MTNTEAIHLAWRDHLKRLELKKWEKVDKVVNNLLYMFYVFAVIVMTIILKFEYLR